MQFSLKEMRRRLDTVRQKMEAAGMNALLITGIENFSYFVGVPVSLYQSRRPWCVLIPLESEPVVLAKEGNVANTVAEEGFFREVVGYPFPVALELPPRIADQIKRRRIKRLGCELGLEMRLGMPPADFEAVVRLLPGVEIVDAAGVIWSLRMTKSPEEAARMKRACEITGNTRQEVFRRIKPGMTEAEVAALWADLMHDAGAECPSFIYMNTGGTNLLPSRTKKLQRGETFWLDGGAYVGGYTCDFSRVAILGPASERQKQLHRDAVEVSQMLVDRVRPGVPVAELSRVAAHEMARRGYNKGGRSLEVSGHSMGMLINEPPLLASWDDTVLTEGLVAGIELGPVEREGMFLWEQLVQVTKDGCEVFTKEPSTLFIVDC
jgi:Xaa-Pro aminopeptidase